MRSSQHAQLEQHVANAVSVEARSGVTCMRRNLRLPDTNRSTAQNQHVLLL